MLSANLPATHLAALHCSARAAHPAAAKPQPLLAACSSRGRAPQALSGPRGASLATTAVGPSGSSHPGAASRPADRIQVVAEATAQAERPVEVASDAAPRLHVGPPAFIKATGRIVASEQRVPEAARGARLPALAPLWFCCGSGWVAGRRCAPEFVRCTAPADLLCYGAV